MSAKVIAFVNSKGGVGKTTSAINVATQLRIKRKKVLIVDLDPQGDASYMMGLNLDDVKDSHIGHALMDPTVFENTIYEKEFIKKDGNKVSRKDIYISPAHEVLDTVANHLINDIARETKLSKCLTQVKDDYDYIILDCPPNKGVTFVNALGAADFYILVVDSEPLAMKNIITNTNIVRDVQENINPKLALLGVLLTKFESSTSLHQAVLEALESKFTKKVFNVKIPKNIDVAEASSAPLCSHSAKSKGNLAYIELTKEILKKVKAQ